MIMVLVATSIYYLVASYHVALTIALVDSNAFIHAWKIAILCGQRGKSRVEGYDEKKWRLSHLKSCSEMDL
ncbi:hypothetical protein NQ317_000397 [Molorchus minor]|uniref:Uncharacterized protein n=1 Tax=Molorchus minor TaxID=1323400 RepID=A0ABQ9J4P9_9CUCU|nr:hypothetical protein NQ317_000397 [Molorchus minor]